MGNCNNRPNFDSKITFIKNKNGEVLSINKRYYKSSKPPSITYHKTLKNGEIINISNKDFNRELDITNE